MTNGHDGAPRSRDWHEYPDGYELTAGAQEAYNRAIGDFAKQLQAEISRLSKAEVRDQQNKRLSITSNDVEDARHRLAITNVGSAKANSRPLWTGLLVLLAIAVGVAANYVQLDSWSGWLAFGSLMIATLSIALSLTTWTGRHEKATDVDERVRVSDFLGRFEMLRTQMMAAATSVLGVDQPIATRDALSLLQAGALWEEGDTERYWDALRLRNSIVHDTKPHSTTEIVGGIRDIERLSTKITAMTGIGESGRFRADQ